VIFNFEAFAGRRGVEREETRGRNEGEELDEKSERRTTS
jgi:hypothetical protein